MSKPPEVPDKPLRRDAVRNLERIRAAAIAVFRKHGLDASHELIAKEADVSIGTVYRRFPDREELIDTLFEDELDLVVGIANESLQMDDAWAGLVHLLERTLELSVDNRGLIQLVNGSDHGAERIERVRGRLAPLGVAVMERAIASGALRSDAAVQDFPIMTLILGNLVDSARSVEPDIWRRYLAIILDGLRPEDQSRPALPDPVSMQNVDRIVTEPPL